MLPRGNFWKIRCYYYAFSCALKDIKLSLDGYFDVGGVCIELESDLFLIDMAAEGRGNTILTRALQLVPGPSKLLGDSRPTLTSFILRNGHRNVFSPPLVFLPSRFDAPSVHLVYSCLERSYVRIARASEAYETSLRTFRFRSSVINDKNKPFAKKEPIRLSWHFLTGLRGLQIHITKLASSWSNNFNSQSAARSPESVQPRARVRRPEVWRCTRRGTCPGVMVDCN